MHVQLHWLYIIELEDECEWSVEKQVGGQSQLKITDFSFRLYLSVFDFTKVVTWMYCD